MFTTKKITDKWKNRPVRILDAFLVEHLDSDLARIKNDEVLAKDMDMHDVPCQRI